VKSIRYIPFLHIHPEIKREMVLEFERFYDDHDYILGKGLEKFENEYANFNEVKYAIGAGNGHDALLIILKCLGIGKGDEVIIPAHTFIATALAVVNAGALPVLADVDEHTFNIHPMEIERKITQKTRAIVPVHLYGNPADLSSIRVIADKYQLPVIEDNAQAQGAEIGGKKTGGFGIMNFTSFYPTKNIGALGDGGMITTNSPEHAEKAKTFRNYGKTKDGEYSSIGTNSRLDELQARLLSVKLKYLRRWNEERIEIASLYEERLQNVEGIKLQSSYADARNVRHIFPVQADKRDELKDYLKSLGIDTLIHYKKPIHLQPAFSFLGHQSGGFPAAEKICREELSLPIYPGLKQEDVIYVCEAIKQFYL
jgi:dTDP-4-amino-4,6-dideoxygalactose transaminase